jgi:hypothetical protein
VAEMGAEKRKLKEKEDNLEKILSKDTSNPEREKENEDIDNFDLNSVRIKQGVGLFFIHLWALIIKRI